MADRFNIEGLIVGAAGALIATAVSKPDTLVSEEGKPNYPVALFIAGSGALVGYFVADKIEGLNVFRKLGNVGRKVVGGTKKGAKRIAGGTAKVLTSTGANIKNLGSTGIRKAGVGLRGLRSVF